MEILNSNIQVDQILNPNNEKFQIPMPDVFITQLMEFGILNYWILKIYAVLGKALLLKNNKIPTPVEIAISATLKMALKNLK